MNVASVLQILAGLAWLAFVHRCIFSGDQRLPGQADQRRRIDLDSAWPSLRSC